MEALLYFALWAAFIFLMMRLGCGVHIMGRGPGGGPARNPDQPGADAPLRWMPPKQDTDPVCNKTVIPDKAKPSVHDGNVYYFCSRECREVFEAAPGLYVGGGAPDRARLEHSHA